MEEKELLLKEFCSWLQNKGFIDSDWYTEEPNAVEDFLLNN